MNKLQIQEAKIDWLKMVKLALNKQGWGRKYIMYTYGTTTISCVIRSFNFETETAMFTISVEYKLDDNIKSTYTFAEYVLQNFSVESFKIHMFNRLIKVMTNTLLDETKELANAKFKQLHTYTWNITEEQVETAGFKDALDTIRKIENEDLQETCFEELQSEVAKIVNKEYDLEISRYCRQNPVYLVGFYNIISSMQKDLDKLTKPDSE